MRSLLSAAFASVALLLNANVHADELVLELTTKLGVEKTVEVASVNAGDMTGPASGIVNWIPERLKAADKKYLALRPSSSDRHPNMLIAIPWQSIKEIDAKNERHTVICIDGVKFTGTILTEVTTTDGKKYPLESCNKVTVKKVTKTEKKDDVRLAAKCRVQFDNLDQSFEARGVGFTDFRTPEQFQMKLGGEVLSGNLSDFEKVVVKGSESGPIRITVRSPKGKETDGELLNMGYPYPSLVFHTTNGCTVVLRVGLVGASSGRREASFTATIESTKPGEKLAIELVQNFVEKKK